MPNLRGLWLVFSMSLLLAPVQRASGATRTNRECHETRNLGLSPCEEAQADLTAALVVLDFATENIAVAVQRLNECLAEAEDPEIECAHWQQNFEIWDEFLIEAEIAVYLGYILVAQRCGAGT